MPQTGARPASSRPRIGSGKVVNTSISLLPDDLDYLLSINPVISKAIRQLIKERKERDNGTVC